MHKYRTSCETTLAKLINYPVRFLSCNNCIAKTRALNSILQTTLLQRETDCKTQVMAHVKQTWLVSVDLNCWFLQKRSSCEACFKRTTHSVTDTATDTQVLYRYKSSLIPLTLLQHVFNNVYASCSSRAAAPLNILSKHQPLQSHI